MCGKRVKLLKDHAHAAAKCAERVGHFAIGRASLQQHVVDLHFAGFKCFQTVDAPQQRALAAARGADHRGHFATLHGERNAIENAEVAVAFLLDCEFDHGTHIRMQEIHPRLFFMRHRGDIGELWPGLCSLLRQLRVTFLKRVSIRRATSDSG